MKLIHYRIIQVNHKRSTTWNYRGKNMKLIHYINSLAKHKGESMTGTHCTNINECNSLYKQPGLGKANKRPNRQESTPSSKH